MHQIDLFDSHTGGDNSGSHAHKDFNFQAA